MISGSQNTDTEALAETLDADELGLDPASPWPLRFTPAATWSPLVISFPHVGLEWPADEPRPRPAVDFARNADLDVDHLYPDVAALGAATVRARFSRLLIDLNRASDDVSAALVPDHPAPRPRQPPWAIVGGRAPVHNRGLIWRMAVGNVPIFAGSLTFAEVSRRLRRYYDPYHRALEILLARRCARFGYAVLLDAHSMPSSVPGDLVLGTFEGGACSPELEARALTALSAPGLHGLADGPGPDLLVRLNDPYRGGELVRKFGRPELGVHALQLEVNRALYMDETSLRLRPEIPPASPLSSMEIRPSQSVGARPGQLATARALRGPAAAPAAPPAAAPLALLYRVRSLVTALAAVTGPPASAAGPALISPPRATALFGEPLCRRTPRG